MEQQETQQRILGHTVGREISAEEIAQISGASGDGANVGTGPFRIGRQIYYMDMGPDPTL